ncbi:EpsG family protein [Aerococcaceae bacterium DSM 111020]|nr:EpsG family protein [Aerococcaceae bacterium DSM 111020]
MKPIFQLISYVVFTFLCFVVFSINFNPTNQSLAIHPFKKNKKRKFNVALFLSNICVLVLAIIFGILSVFYSADISTLDRFNYAIRYTQPLIYPEPWTTGLNFIVNIIRQISLNPDLLYFTISFVCFFVVMIAYFKSKKTTPYTLLLIMFSNLLIYSFYLLKQAPSIAISALFFVLMIEEKWISGLVLLLICVSFHEAALILVPIYLYLVFLKRFSQSTHKYVLLLVVLIFLFFPYINQYFIRVFLIFVPSLADEISDYIVSSGIIVDSSNLLTIFRGIPYYLITINALFNREYLTKKIPQIDIYIVLSLFASLSMGLSFYMYWMSRFAAYFYFPSLVLAGLMAEHNRKTLINRLLNIGILLSLSFFTIRYLAQIFFIHGGF